MLLITPRLHNPELNRVLILILQIVQRLLVTRLEQLRHSSPLRDREGECPYEHLRSARTGLPRALQAERMASVRSQRTDRSTSLPRRPIPLAPRLKRPSTTLIHNMLSGLRMVLAYPLWTKRPTMRLVALLPRITLLPPTGTLAHQKTHPRTTVGHTIRRINSRSLTATVLLNTARMHNPRRTRMVQVPRRTETPLGTVKAKQLISRVNRRTTEALSMTGPFKSPTMIPLLTLVLSYLCHLSSCSVNTAWLCVVRLQNCFLFITPHSTVALGLFWTLIMLVSLCTVSPLIKFLPFQVCCVVCI